MLPIAMLGGPQDMVIVAVVILVLFGGSKIGPWGKQLGEGIREFKKATKEDDPGDAPVKPKATVSSKDEEK
jgi:sec-independent protein translocase protein TatA